MLLGQQGASVVRIERPAAESPAAPAHAVWNRYKESRVLNLKDPRDRDAALRLAADADVVIENFRPGVMERLGCGASSLTTINPRLIYCSIPGFAADDHRAQMPAWEGVVHAASGLYNLVGAGSEPAYTTIPLASFYGAVHAVINVTVALLRRERTGQGAHIEVPLFRAMLSGTLSFRVRTPRGRLAYGATRSTASVHHVTPFDATYRCRDGRYLYVLAGDHSKFADTLVSMLGLRDDPALDLIEQDPWLGAHDRNIKDPFFLSSEINQRLYVSLAKAFAARSAEEWEQQLIQAGIPAAVCRTTSEWLDTESVPTGPLVDVRAQKSRANTSSGGRPSIARHAAPGDGPLAAVRVLDMSTVVAGPVCARTLAEFGADVIKIDSPRPNHNPIFTCALGIDVNRGKRSVLLDLKDADGRDVWRRLLATADVVVENLSAKGAASLSIRPECEGRGLVRAQVNAFGFHGDWTGRKGYDPVVQAASGIQSRFGGSASPRVHGTASTLDYLTGYAAAFGIVLALFQRQRTARSAIGDGVTDRLVQTSLAHAAVLVQSGFADSCKRGSINGDEGRNGSAVFNRMYRCLDGWVYVACPGLRAEDLMDLPPFHELKRKATTDIEGALEVLIASGTVGLWTRRLQEIGIAAHQVMSIRGIRQESLSQKDALFLTLTYPHLGPVDILSTGPFIRDLLPRINRYAPKLGSHTFEILSELKLPASLTSRLFAKNAVSESLGHEYVP
jgi:crotonobetainyl-CoA:carnitine CoA-transferase CaiB-like acyl-CoA transferase